jgi:hypothetical protein
VIRTGACAHQRRHVLPCCQGCGNSGPAGVRFFTARCIFVGLVLASVTGSAFGAEVNAAAISSAEPSKKTLLTPSRPRQGSDCKFCSTGYISRRARLTVNSVRIQEGVAGLRRGPSAGEFRGGGYRRLGEARVGRPPGDYELRHLGQRRRRAVPRKLPAKMEAMKDLPKPAYTSAREGLAEKFHRARICCRP